MLFMFTSLQLSLIPSIERWVEKDSNWIPDTVGRWSVPCGCLESRLSVSNKMLLACWEKPSDCTANIQLLTMVRFRDKDGLNIHLCCQRFITVRKYTRQSAHLKERFSFATVLEDSIHGCRPVSPTAGDTHIMAGLCGNDIYLPHGAWKPTREKEMWSQHLLHIRLVT